MPANDFEKQGASPDKERIPELVAQIYEIAIPEQRARILERLLQPLGLLSICAVAHGIFAGMRFRSGWHDIDVRIEELTAVRSDDVVSLVAYVQQVSVEAVDSLAQFVLASPQLAASAAGAILITALLERHKRCSRDFHMSDEASAPPYR